MAPVKVYFTIDQVVLVGGAISSPVSEMVSVAPGDGPITARVTATPIPDRQGNEQIIVDDTGTATEIDDGRVGVDDDTGDVSVASPFLHQPRRDARAGEGVTGTDIPVEIISIDDNDHFVMVPGTFLGVAVFQELIEDLPEARRASLRRGGRVSRFGWCRDCLEGGVKCQSGGVIEVTVETPRPISGAGQGQSPGRFGFFTGDVIGVHPPLVHDPGRVSRVQRGDHPNQRRFVFSKQRDVVIVDVGDNAGDLPTGESTGNPRRRGNRQ